jgi:hypothetical protein
LVQRAHRAAHYFPERAQRRDDNGGACRGRADQADIGPRLGAVPAGASTLPADGTESQDKDSVVSLFTGFTLICPAQVRCRRNQADIGSRLAVASDLRSRTQVRGPGPRLLPPAA